MPVQTIASNAGDASSFVGKLLTLENHDLACDATEGFFLKKKKITLPKEI